MSNTTAYIQQTWVDHQQDPVTGDVLVQGSSMDAEHFNHMEAGIKVADTVAREAAAGLGNMAPAIHNHDDRYYTETEMNTLLAGKSGTGHTHTPDSLGAAPTNHSHTPESIGAAPASHTHTKSQIPDFAHNQAASTITAGTLAGQVKANATAAATIATAQVRDIYAGTSDMVAGSTALATGTLYFMYE